MALFVISVPKGRRMHLGYVEKAISKTLGEKVTVTRVMQPQSRAERFWEAAGRFEDIKTTIAELKDELQEWHDNLPENFQGGQTADELQEAIVQLELLENKLNAIEFVGVEFPGMFEYLTQGGGGSAR